MPTEQPSLGDFLAAWELFRDPLLCALAAGIVLGYLSVYVVLRRMVFVSAAVTQSAGLGVALAFYGEIHLGLTLEPIYLAAMLALGATLLLLVEPERLRLTRESVLGLLFAATGGAAVLVGDRIAQEAHDIQAILFGTAVLVRPLDLRVVLAVGAVVMALQLWWRRGFALASFDPVAARVQGLPVGLLQGLLLVSIGLAVGTTARALGALPIFALSTLPALSALLLGTSLELAFLLAALLGAVAGVGGYLGAFFLGFPVGASQTVTASLLVLVALTARVVGRLPAWLCRMRRANRAIGLVALVGFAGLAGCDANGTGPGQAASAATSPAVSSAPTEAERASALAAERAADELYPYVEKLAAAVARSKGDGGAKPDCTKLAAELSPFATESADAMAKSRERGGGKLAVERALKRKYGERYEALFDVVLEAVEVDCASEPAVAEAARRIDL